MSKTLPVFFRSEQNVESNNSYSPSAGKPKQALADWVKKFPSQIEVRSFEPVTRDTLCLAHDPAYIDGLLACELPNGFNNHNPDVAASIPYTVGSLVAACRHAVENRTIAVSPTSGFHHANYRYGSGFCSVNGLVIAALELRRLGLVKNVLIIDGDGHYGDGTDSCIAATNSSSWIKQITATKHYETAGEFFKRIDIKSLMSKYEEFWQDIGSTLVIYQAGADAWKSDPLGAGLFALDELRRRDEQIIHMARKYRVPLAINLAGGYSKDASGSIEPVLKIHRQTIQASIKSMEAKNDPA
jgi:acetoin utilization deacetylase AcuC-like enzyme